MSSSELGLNVIPQYTNFSVGFNNITKDDAALNFNTVGAWVFALSSVPTGTPQVLKQSTGVASGDFTINGGARSVTLAMRASEINNGHGQYFVKLFAYTSGVYTTHRMKFITIEEGLSPT